MYPHTLTHITQHQSCLFQMKYEANSLSQVEIIWARSTHLSTKWANLTARLHLVNRRLSPSQAVKVTGHRLKRKSLNVHSYAHTKPHFSSWYFSDYCLLITPLQAVKMTFWINLFSLKLFWLCVKGRGACTINQSILFSWQRYFNRILLLSIR